MAAFNDVFDSIVNTPGTPANSFELGLDVTPLGGGGFLNIPDITDLNPQDAAKTRGRETYASKGVDTQNKYAASMTTSVNIEIVRDAAGQWQPALVDLMKAARSLGASNRRAYRVYDLLGADYAFSAIGAVSTNFNGNDWDSAKWVTVTFGPYGKATWLTVNPTAVGVISVVTEALPTGATATTVLILHGDNFTGATGVTIGGVAATGLAVLSDNTIRCIVPAGSAGSAPIVVTTANGASAAFPYVRGA